MTVESSSSGDVRLQKILADHGIASRRECERIIKSGEVTINGRIAKVGDKANPHKDHIKLRGKLLQTSKLRILVVAVFKPRDVLSQRSDDATAEKGTVFDLIPFVKERLQPIGRLDKDAEGILLLTNDGELSHRLLLGKYEIPKVYTVKMEGHLDEVRLRRLTHGVNVEDTKSRPMTVEVGKKSEGKEWVRVTTTEVRNRMVRKAFEAVGRPLDKIRRDSFAGISLRGLTRGQARLLTPEEVLSLRKWVGLA